MLLISVKIHIEKSKHPVRSFSDRIYSTQAIEIAISVHDGLQSFIHF